MEIRDPIHGFIILKGEEVEIICSSVFQRLRRIRQLAFANLVYPGALHTRFDHTLGVFCLAERMAASGNLDLDQKRLVRLAALLHDLGHGPFSHVTEQVLEIFANYEELSRKLGGKKPDKIHELVTQDILSSDPSLNRILGKQRIEDVKNLLSRGHEDPVLKAIISGPLDADKQDYLLRDSYFCGVKYGIFDIDRLHLIFKFESNNHEEKTLMVAPDGVHTLEQFVLAKYFLTAQVYGHRVRRITDQMIVRAIVLGIEEDGIDLLRKLFTYSGEESFCANFVQWDDWRFMSAFGGPDSKHGYCQDLIARLTERRLLKEIFDKPQSALPESCRATIKEISKPKHRARRRSIEAQIAASLQNSGVNLDGSLPNPEKLVIVQDYSLKSVREQSRNDEGSIMIAEDPPVPFEEASQLFRSIDDKLTVPHFAVYAPVSYDNPIEKKRLRSKAEKAIIACLEDLKDGE
ncbi:MAG TPA: HD domain-containing protein [Terracidiphilus sp.]|nr:HD domain-containing protein [Terracidiphilus sp.]